MNKYALLLFTALLTNPVYSADDNPATDSRVIATVNGISISGQELQHFISKLSQPVATERALQELINIELLVQAAKKQGVMQDPELMLEIKRTTSGLIASHYLQQHLLKLKLTEQDLKSRYNREYVEGNQAREYNANHILVKTEQEAKDIIQQLDKGADFTELAKTLSTGPSGKDGGALGWFKSTDMVAPFSQAAMLLVAGKYSAQPVQTQFGWHVILLNDTRVTEPPAFESVKKKLSSAIAAESISKLVKDLHDAATIELK